VGIVQAGAGTTGFAQVGVSGVLNCQFDSSAPSQGDYSSLSSAVGGECSAVAHTPANENPNTNIFYGTVDTTASAGAVTTVDVSQIPNTYAVQNGWIGPPYLTLLAAASYGGGYAVPSILQQTKPTAASGAAIIGGGDFWWPYVNTGFYSVTGPSSLGVSGHDFILLDSLSNADPYATPMGRINASWYVVPDVASQNGEIQTARSGNYWAFGASNLHIWTLTGAATLGPLINDNAGDIQIFDIVQAASGGPYTFTWPVAFTNPPAISTVASSSTIAAFLFDGTNYNCVWGCPSSGGGGTVNSAAANQLAYYASTGTAVSGTNALPAGTTAATQTAGDNTTKVATTAYVASPGAIAPTSVTAGIYAMPAEYSNGTCITSKTIAPANGNIQNVTLTNGDTCALTFTQPGSGTFFITLKVIQSAVSSYNGTISGCKWPGGTVPTITATTGAVDFVNVYLDGTHAYCEATQNFQ
jgi:hypothetical protein